MFKRKIKVKDNMFIERLECFLGQEIHSGLCKGELLAEELYAFRYGLIGYRIDFNSLRSISRIGINELFCPCYSILAFKDKSGNFETLKKISDQNDIIHLLAQRLILISFNHKKKLINSIKVYIPESNDITLNLDNLRTEFIEKHIDFNEMDFFVQNGQLTHKVDWNNEFFAYTKQKTNGSTIVLHHAP